jgi:hypothetical protein
MKKVILTSLLLAVSLTLTVNGLAQNLNDFSIDVVVNSDINNPEIKKVVLHIVYDASNFNEEMIDTTIIDSVEVLSIITPIPDDLSEINVIIKDASSQIVSTTIIDLINGKNIKIGYNKITTSIGILPRDTYQIEVFVKDVQNTQSETKTEEFIVY